MYKTKEELLKLINPHISDLLDKDKFEIKWYNPFIFLTSDRIDVLLKYLFIKSVLVKDYNPFLCKLYTDDFC